MDIKNSKYIIKQFFCFRPSTASRSGISEKFEQLFSYAGARPFDASSFITSGWFRACSSPVNL